jgi:starch phosphorylase
VACTLRDIFRTFEKSHSAIRDFPSKVVIQLNDTHPALAVAELMRILVDEKSVDWEQAWQITKASVAFTNHTLLPEAQEKWSVALLERVLPRHLQIIYEINHRFLHWVAKVHPGDENRLKRVSLIDSPSEYVRMANLAIVGSHSVNGVSQIHSRLMTKLFAPDFYQLWPERFNNKTNGITQRQWLLKANPGLVGLICGAIGNGWITNLDELRALEEFAEEEDFQAEFRRVKRSNKENLAAIIRETSLVSVDPESLFDIQAKRIHAYKRQLLNVMHIIDEYLSLIEDGREPSAARTYIFAGKAAPGYWAAKQIIKLVHNVGRVINNDRRAREWIKVAFLPDYRVSLAERIIPAADLSEQISTAGMEASGTGNMKFALNGALTIGTLDGANIEIREEVGPENIFLFGLKADELQSIRESHSYRPKDQYNLDAGLRRVVDSFRSNLFCPGEPDLFTWIYHTLLDENDEYFHIADLPAYLGAQRKVARTFCNQTEWLRMAILNVARMGKFSIDRTVREYAREIWHIEAG